MDLEKNEVGLGDRVVMKFAKKLAGNDQASRSRGIKQLKLFLTHVPEDVEEVMLLRLWKGLHFCMWMADKPLFQEELAGRIAGLVHTFSSKTVSTRFYAAFLCLEGMEWPLIDVLRIDKFMMLVRLVTRESLLMLKSTDWKEDLTCIILKSFKLLCDMGESKGLLFHLLNLLPTELQNLIDQPKEKEQPTELVKFLKDLICIFIETISTTHDEYIAKEIKKCLLLTFIQPVFQVDMEWYGTKVMDTASVASCRHRNILFSLLKQIREITRISKNEDTLKMKSKKGLKRGRVDDDDDDGFGGGGDWGNHVKDAVKRLITYEMKTMEKKKKKIRVKGDDDDDDNKDGGGDKDEDEGDEEEEEEDDSDVDEEKDEEDSSDDDEEEENDEDDSDIDEEEDNDDEVGVDEGEVGKVNGKTKKKNEDISLINGVSSDDDMMEDDDDVMSEEDDDDVDLEKDLNGFLDMEADEDDDDDDIADNDDDIDEENDDDIDEENDVDEGDEKEVDTDLKVSNKRKIGGVVDAREKETVVKDSLQSSEKKSVVFNKKCLAKKFHKNSKVTPKFDPKSQPLKSALKSPSTPFSTRKTIVSIKAPTTPTLTKSTPTKTQKKTPRTNSPKTSPKQSPKTSPKQSPKTSPKQSPKTTPAKPSQTTTTKSTSSKTALIKSPNTTSNKPYNSKQTKTTPTNTTPQKSPKTTPGTPISPKSNSALKILPSFANAKDSVKKIKSRQGGK